MDERRFDDLTQVIGDCTSRRGLLRKLGAAAAAVGLTGIATLIGGEEAEARKKGGKKGGKKKSRKGRKKAQRGGKTAGTGGSLGALGATICTHSREDGDFEGCMPTCTAATHAEQGQGCQNTCSLVCDQGCPVQQGEGNDRECTCPLYCDPDCFVCDENGNAKFTDECAARCRGECPGGCGKCETCDKGTCVPKTCGPCETCNPDNGTCESTCNSCQRCHEGQCVAKCDACETCDNGVCSPKECRTCKKCVNGDCVADTDQNGDPCGESGCCDNGACGTCPVICPDVPCDPKYPTGCPEGVEGGCVCTPVPVYDCGYAECPPEHRCLPPETCKPDCGNNVCGDDGCGGSCGSCGDCQTCSGGKCVADPGQNGDSCGSGGCCKDGTCGTCPGPNPPPRQQTCEDGGYLDLCTVNGLCECKSKSYRCIRCGDPFGDCQVDGIFDGICRHVSHLGGGKKKKQRRKKKKQRRKK